MSEEEQGTTATLGRQVREGGREGKEVGKGRRGRLLCLFAVRQCMQRGQHTVLPAISSKREGELPANCSTHTQQAHQGTLTHRLL